MKAITVRTIPPGVVKAVMEKARTEGLSLNRAVVSLLKEAVGETARAKPVIHHDLDHLAGTWSQAEYDEFMEFLRKQREIDPETETEEGTR